MKYYLSIEFDSKNNDLSINGVPLAWAGFIIWIWGLPNLED